MQGLYRITVPSVQAKLEREFQSLDLAYTIDIREDGVWLSVAGSPQYKPSGVILPNGLKVPGCKNWLKQESYIGMKPRPNPSPGLFDEMDARFRAYRNTLLTLL